MALVVKDRVQETSTTTGTGSLTLLGAVTGFQTFSSAIGNTNTTYYTIQGGAEWEVGIGTVSAGALSRDTVLESSNGGSLVDFSAGSKFVFCTYPAEKSVDIETAQTLTNKTISGASNTLSNIGNSSLTNSAITINGTSTSLGGSINVGTVTSVSGTAPVASSGGNTPAISLASGYGDTQNPYASKTAKFVLAAPNAANGVPTFRAIVASDIPTLNQNTTGTAANVTGTVAIANGGTGQTTRQNAMDALAGAVTSGQYLRGNGTDVVMSAIQAADVPTLNQNTTGSAATVTGNATGSTFGFNSGYGSVATAYGCRAWVNFNGTGTVAIRESGNVSSITDNGTGDYTVNFTNAMPDADYSVSSSGATSSSQTAATSFAIHATTSIGNNATLKTTTQVRLLCRGGSNVDVNEANVAIFR